MFNADDVVETINYEYDIEFIPAGTRITLTRAADVRAVYWYGTTTLRGRKRTVLVLASNLKLVN